MTMPGKPKLFVTRKLTQDVEDRIASAYEAVFNEDDHIMSPAELVEKAQGCDGMLVTATEKNDASLIGALPDLLMIGFGFSIDGCQQVQVNVTNIESVDLATTGWRNPSG